jgi:hypothetical protein
MAATTLGAQRIRTLRPERAVREDKVAGMEPALGKGKLWLAVGNNCWRAILCLEGAIWIAQERDFQDHRLEAGEMFIISRPGKVIVQALVDARIQITPCLATAPCRVTAFEDMIFA